MPTRIEIADSELANVLARLAWRLGLGWLVGRWFVLLTTTAGKDRVERTIAPYVFAGGRLFVVAPARSGWPSHVARRPVAEAQASVGPLPVRARRVDEDERAAVAALFAGRAPDLAATAPQDWWVLEATGDRAPEMLAPDLLWVWFAAAASWLVLRMARSIGRREA